MLYNGRQYLCFAFKCIRWLSKTSDIKGLCNFVTFVSCFLCMVDYIASIAVRLCRELSWVDSRLWLRCLLACVLWSKLFVVVTQCMLGVGRWWASCVQVLTRGLMGWGMLGLHGWSVLGLAGTSTSDLDATEYWTGRDEGSVNTQR